MGGSWIASLLMRPSPPTIFLVAALAGGYFFIGWLQRLNRPVQPKDVPPDLERLLRPPPQTPRPQTPSPPHDPEAKGPDER